MKELARLRALRAPLVFFLVGALLCAASAESKKKPPAAPLDLNSASAAQLEQLPGIGPAAAQAIVQFRTKSGPFRRVEDLLAIRGISQRKLDQLRPYLTVGAAKPPKP